MLFRSILKKKRNHLKKRNRLLPAWVTLNSGDYYCDEANAAEIEKLRKYDDKRSWLRNYQGIKKKERDQRIKSAMQAVNKRYYCAEVNAKKIEEGRKRKYDKEYVLGSTTNEVMTSVGNIIPTERLYQDVLYDLVKLNRLQKNRQIDWEQLLSEVIKTLDKLSHPLSTYVKKCLQISDLFMFANIALHMRAPVEDLFYTFLQELPEEDMKEDCSRP